MMIKKVAGRYASALFQEAKNQKLLEKVSTDMQEIHDVITASPELMLFLKSKTISRKIKRDTLFELFKKPLSPLTRQFLNLVFEKKRENDLYDMTFAYQKMIKEEQGQIDIDVFVVSIPDEKQRDLLKKVLEKKTGKKVNLSFSKNRSLIGGMAIKIEDTVMDGTIKHKLQQIDTSFQYSGM